MGGRPRLGDRVAFTIRLPVDLHDRLMAAAQERDLSANHLATLAIAEFVDDLLDVDEACATW